MDRQVPVTATLQISSQGPPQIRLKGACIHSPHCPSYLIMLLMNSNRRPTFNVLNYSAVKKTATLLPQSDIVNT